MLRHWFALEIGCIDRRVILFVSLVIISLILLLFSYCKIVEAWSYFITTNIYIYIYIYIWHRTCTNEIGWVCGSCYKFGYQQRIYGW